MEKTNTGTVPASMLPFEDFNDGLTGEMLPVFKSLVEETLRAPNTIYEQKRQALAGFAMRALPYPSISDQAEALIRDEIIDLISEGPAPFHPRYVAPLFDKLLRDGSDFLELAPAQDLHQATAHLLTAYHYFPSEGLPVFLGRLDELLEPYFHTVSEETARAILRSFWLMVDRLNPSAFAHANIGPEESRTGRLLLEVDRELKTITNISLRYHSEITPDDFALQAVENQLQLAKPYFVNHPLMVTNWGEDYVVASCYNAMRLGGGIFTLVRLNLKEMVTQLSDGSITNVLEQVIPKLAPRYVEVINSRTRFIVEEIGWFEHNWWVKEGLIEPDKFTAYAGIFGLAEAVNWLMEQKGEDARFGHDPAANALAQEIITRLGEELEQYPADYCSGWHDGRVNCHAQVGISTDLNVTPGVRVPSGDEPTLYEHILCEAPLHACMPGGVSTILEFNQTALKNPRAVLDIAKGAMASGTRTLSIGSSDAEFIRVTGYLVRRADLERFHEERANRHSSASLGGGFFETKPNHLHRRERKV